VVALGARLRVPGPREPVGLLDEHLGRAPAMNIHLVASEADESGIGGR